MAGGYYGGEVEELLWSFSLASLRDLLLPSTSPAGRGGVRNTRRRRKKNYQEEAFLIFSSPGGGTVQVLLIISRMIKNLPKQLGGMTLFLVFTARKVNTSPSARKEALEFTVFPCYKNTLRLLFLLGKPAHLLQDRTTLSFFATARRRKH